MAGVFSAASRFGVSTAPHGSAAGGGRDVKFGRFDVMVSRLRTEIGGSSGGGPRLDALEYLAHRRVERECLSRDGRTCTRLDETQNRGGRELLGQRADVIDGTFVRWRIGPRLAETLGEDELAVDADGQRQRRDAHGTGAWREEPLHQRIDAAGRVGRPVGPRRSGEEQQGSESDDPDASHDSGRVLHRRSRTIWIGSATRPVQAHQNAARTDL